MTTLEKVRDLVADHLCLSVDKVTKDADIVKDLNADSIDLVDMITTFEDEFGVSIPDEKLSSLRTVGDIVKFIDENK